MLRENKKNKNVIVFSHDAGGGKVIKAIIERELLNPLCIVSGPS